MPTVKVPLSNEPTNPVASPTPPVIVPYTPATGVEAPGVGHVVVMTGGVESTTIVTAFEVPTWPALSLCDA